MDGAAVAALLADAAARGGSAGFRLARLTVDLLRPVPLMPLALSARTVRDGRRLKLLDVSLSFDGTEVSRASAQLLVETELPAALSDTAAPPIPPPAECAPQDMSAYGRFVGTWENRSARTPADPGGDRLASAWWRCSTPLFPDEQMSGAARIAAAADRGFGFALTTSEGLGFINSDFTVYLAREPRGEWLAVDGSLRLSDVGIAVWSSWLRDEAGAFGTVTAAALAQDRAIEAQ